jgi:hypothetical protein
MQIIILLQPLRLLYITLPFHCQAPSGTRINSQMNGRRKIAAHFPIKNVSFLRVLICGT